MTGWRPDQEVLARYGELLVNFGLTGGEPLRSGAVVWVSGPDNAKPLFAEVCRSVWRAGAHVIRGYEFSDEPDLKLDRNFYELASDEQLNFFPEHYWHGLIDQCDHAVHIRSFTDPRALEGVAAEKLVRKQRSMLPMVEWQVAKELAKRFSFTVGLYGTEAMAAEAGMSIEEYWEQIVVACFLDDPDPIARWRQVDAQIAEQCRFLNELQIERLRVEGADVDLELTLGERRRWIGGGGANIPSYEVFTTPDWRGTEGQIRFSEPLYTRGLLITEIELEFREGRVIAARAKDNEELLKEMLALQGADRVGEFSLTDARLSRVTRFMAEILFDENTGGRFGNTHIALGLGLREAYEGDAAKLSEEDWERLGFNMSAVHTDIVSTTDRTVTAVLSDGTKRVIYADGRFQADQG